MKKLTIFLVLFFAPVAGTAQTIGYSGGVDVGLSGPISSGVPFEASSVGISSLNLLGLNIAMEDFSATVEVGVPIAPSFSAQSPIGLYLHPFGSTKTRPLMVAKLRPVFLSIASSTDDMDETRKLYGGYGEVGLGYQFGFYKEQLGIRVTFGYVGGTFREYGRSEWLGYHHGGVINISLVSFIGLFDEWK